MPADVITLTGVVLEVTPTGMQGAHRWAYVRVGLYVGGCPLGAELTVRRQEWTAPKVGDRYDVTLTPEAPR